MQGQANHFVRYAPEHIEYGVKRYTNETRRLYRVLNSRLEATQAPYLVGDKCTIADIAHWGWICMSTWSGVDIDEFPLLKQWELRMLARPGVEKGRHVPRPHRGREMGKDPEAAAKAAEASRKWIQESMAADAKM